MTDLEKAIAYLETTYQWTIIPNPAGFGDTQSYRILMPDIDVVTPAMTTKEGFAKDGGILIRLAELAGVDDRDYEDADLVLIVKQAGNKDIQIGPWSIVGLEAAICQWHIYPNTKYGLMLAKERAGIQEATQ